MIIVLGSVRARDGRIGDLVAVARAHVLRARDQPGCIAHEMAIDDSDRDRLVFTERWTDLACLQHHLSSEATRAFGAACSEIGEGARLEVFEATSLQLHAPQRDQTTRR